MAAENELLPEALTIVTDGQHDEFLIKCLLSLPVLLEESHVWIGQGPLCELFLELRLDPRRDLVVLTS